ncbi:MAG: polysaccharide biosynthesis tyrosine autokinase [Acidobacteria bacterium]|nr:polysaccharide biosynthesis tyrosine autokinase [Acidobacteriota bacterium]
MAEENKDLEKALTTEESAMMRPFAAPRPTMLKYDYGYGYGQDSANGIHLREIWRMVRKRKWLILVIATIATILVAIEVHRTPSIYRAETTMEIGKDAATVVKTSDQVIQIDDSDNINTNKIVFKSRPMLEDVVVILRLDTNPRFIETMHKKSIVDALKDISFRISGKVIGSIPQSEESSTTMAPAPLMERTPEESHRLAPYVAILKNKLEVEAIDDTRIMKISFEHTDPALAQAVVNTAAKNFRDRNYERKTDRFKDTSGWLDRSTRELKSKVQQAEQAMADYTQRNGIFTSEGKETLIVEKLTNLYNLAMRAETERMLKQSLFEEVQRGRIAQLPEAFSDTKSAAIQGELSKLRVDEAELSVKYGPDNPKVAEVRSKIKSLNEQQTETRSYLEEKLKADYERAQRDERSMKAALEKTKTEAVQQNQASIQYSILKQEVDTAKSLYTEFLQKTKQTELQLAEQHNNLRIIELADMPSSPIGPQRFRTMLIGLLVSLIAGIGLAFFLEYLDNTVKSVEDVSRVAQLPTLAVIPSINTVSARALAGRKNVKAEVSGLSAQLSPAAENEHGKLTKLVTLDQLSSVVEAYRMLRTSVLLSAAGRPPKIILFTSGQPGEGKTTTAINTAISLSQLGSSVLLIDADLRRPTVHRVFKMNQSQGLSTYLSRQVDIEPLIHKLWVPNLSVLPCGPIPPNPAELISSERMKEVLKLLSDKYDHILIDSPPLINVTDPVILSTMVDGVILVVQAGRSTRDIVRRARHELSSVGAKIFGVVLNNLDIKREGYGNYVSTYGNYGYTENREEAGRH